ncbi:MAG: serine hydrolase [Saprospiraceae bacterium]
MKTINKKVIIFLVLLLGFVCFFSFYLYPRLSIATGFAAKAMCSCHFVAGREVAEIQKNVLYHSLLPYVSNVVNETAKEVTSTFLGMKPKVARYKEGVGCFLVSSENSGFLYTIDTTNFNTNTLQPSFQWISGKTFGTNMSGLETAVENAFDLGRKIDIKKTTAVLVIHKDTLIAEAYAKPFEINSLQLGWSMTKSLMNTFIGLMVMNGKVDLSQHSLFPSWKNDDRKNITLNDLLHMSSGLSWEEDYTKVSDVTKMLYEGGNVTLIPLNKKLSHPAGSHWLYSSGTSNLISLYIRNQFSNDEAYFSYMKRRLFNVLGMESIIMETDQSGHFIGSTYTYATPRDWAKFGLLYLHDGVWMGKRLLPDYWVNYSKSPAEHSDHKYGAHFWINKNFSHYKDAPEDMFFADGYQGQFVFIIPSKDLVIVRMGIADKDFDVNTFLKEILQNIQ